MSAPRPFDGKVVVVIEDDRLILAAMNSLLSGWGCDVVMAGSLGAAREELARRAVPPDAVIADYRLVEGTGVSAIAALQQQYGERLPAALVTGDTGPAALADITRSGIVYFHKPVKPKKLRELLTSLLAQS